MFHLIYVKQGFYICVIGIESATEKGVMRQVYTVK